MENNQIAEMLKLKIKEVEDSDKNIDKNQKITMVHLGSTVFLRMAKLFILIHTEKNKIPKFPEDRIEYPSTF